MKADELSQLNNFLKLVGVNNFSDIGKVGGQLEESKKRKPRSQSRGRPKKVKKILPEGVKKPVSCYMLYNKKRMPELNKLYPGKTVGDLAKLISEEWKIMSEEAKNTYREIHRIEKEKYAITKGGNSIQSVQSISKLVENNKVVSSLPIQGQNQIYYAPETDAQIDQCNQEILINGSNQYNFQPIDSTLNQGVVNSVGLMDTYNQNLYSELNQQQRI